MKKIAIIIILLVSISCYSFLEGLKKELEKNNIRVNSIYRDKRSPYTASIGITGFLDGAKWQAERMYNREEVEKLLINFSNEHGTQSNRGNQINWIKENLTK